MILPFIWCSLTSWDFSWRRNDPSINSG